MEVNPLSMKIVIATLVLTFGVITSSFSQNVRLLFKNGETKTEELQAFSDIRLFLKNSTVEISSLESISFASEDVVDKKLKGYLTQARVQILFSNELSKPGQASKGDYPKEGSQTITLTCQDSSRALFKRIGQHLATKGYGIDYSSAELFTIKTSFRPIAKPRYSYFLNVVVIGNRVVITAQWKTTRSEVFDWIYSSKKGNFKSRVSQVLHNDLIKNLDGFHRLETVYR